MDRTRKAEEIAASLKAARKVLIVTHKNPDGDAIGASLALAYALLSLGKEVQNVNVDGVPGSLIWLEGADMIAVSPPPDFNPDALVILDCNDPSRTGFAPETFAGIPVTLVIDHHPGGPTGTGTLVDPAAASSGTLVYEVIRAMGAQITPSTALSLYISLHTDTGGFRFGNTTAEAFRLAAELADAGAVPSNAAVMLMEREDASRMKLLGLALGTLEVAGSGRVAMIHVTCGMFEATGTKDEHTDGFVNYPRSIDGVEAALLFKEKSPGVWRVALRSKGLVDVSAIAREFNGGGHRNASGATVEGELDVVKTIILQRVISSLEEAGLI